jgi:hypothetical protein
MITVSWGVKIIPWCMWQYVVGYLDTSGQIIDNDNASKVRFCLLCDHIFQFSLPKIWFDFSRKQGGTRILKWTIVCIFGNNENVKKKDVFITSKNLSFLTSISSSIHHIVHFKSITFSR